MLHTKNRLFSNFCNILNRTLFVRVSPLVHFPSFSTLSHQHQFVKNLSLSGDYRGVALCLILTDNYIFLNRAVLGGKAIRAGVLGLSDNIQIIFIVGRIMNNVSKYNYYKNREEEVLLCSAEFLTTFTY